MESEVITEWKKERAGELTQKIRVELLLALRYAKGENSNLIRVSTHIRDALDSLDKLGGMLE